MQGTAASGEHCRATFLMITRKPDINKQCNAPCLGTPLFRGPLPWVGDSWRWKVSGNGSSPRHCISAPKGRRRLWPWSESLNHRIPEREEPQGIIWCKPISQTGREFAQSHAIHSVAKLELAPRYSDSQAKALSTTLHCFLRQFTGENTKAQKGSVLGQPGAGQEGGRERQRERSNGKFGRAPTMISTQACGWSHGVEATASSMESG